MQPHAAVRDLPAPLDRSSPVWVAPMAGGPSTPRLVVAAARAGHFAQLAAGYKSAEAMTREVREVRDAGTELFGVNLFVPNVHPITEDAYEGYARSLRPTAARLHHQDAPVALREDDDEWDAKIAALVADPVPAVSFTFGLPSSAAIEDLHRAGSVLLQTVTSPQEARRAAEAGVDALVVQGFAAGGHSGVWDADAWPAEVPLSRLVEEVASVVSLPLVAAGGIAGPRAVDAAMTAGASAVAVGTVVLRAPESGASDLHKNALADPQYTSTALTRAFTGRPARALVNRFVLDHDEASPSGYPALHHLTRPLRAAAAAANDPSALNLWAGQQWQGAPDAPVADILDGLMPAGARMAP